MSLVTKVGPGYTCDVGDHETQDGAQALFRVDLAFYCVYLCRDHAASLSHEMASLTLAESMLDLDQFLRG